MTEEINNTNEVNKGGVKTEEGKAISKMNALKHGLLSRSVVLNYENKDEFEAFRLQMIKKFEPADIFEEVLVDRIVCGFWRLKRAIFVEKNMMEWYEENREEFAIFKESALQEERKQIRNTLGNESIENILRYEASIDRSTWRAVHELERLQAKRMGKQVELPTVLDMDIGGSFGKNLSS